MKSSSRIVSFVVLLKISVTLLLFGSLEGQPFSGFDSASLTPVHNIQGEWGLKIVVLNVGQADAILVIAPNGDVVLIDAGRSNAHGNQIADFLEASQLNGVGNIKTVNLLYSTHYDADHIGGLKQLKARGFAIRKSFDQGLSTARTPVTAAGNRSTYGKYVTAVGDPNNNYQQDPGESDFCRNRIEFGHTESIGQNDLVQIRCVAVRGDTEGTSEDINLDPSQGSINENPGSIALIIRLGDFELYTAGDQTDDDWKHEPEAEEAVIDSGAIHGGNDIDVLKVSHHGSDTSTSDAIAEELDPEVAVISTKFSGAKLPKKTTLKQLEENRCFVLITGDGHDPSTNTFTGSSHSEDDGYTPSTSAVFNNQGNVTILVSPDGSRYTVFGGTFQRTFSAVDQDNHR